MAFQYDDGGRTEAGFKGTTGDCGARAMAIATGIGYQAAYDLLNAHASRERASKRRRGKSNARTGIHGVTMRRAMEALGWIWVPTMTIGSGCKVHLRASELPAGRILCNVSKHYVAVIDGVIHDIFDPSRDGTRCVYGYYREA